MRNVAFLSFALAVFALNACSKSQSNPVQEQKAPGTRSQPKGQFNASVASEEGSEWLLATSAVKCDAAQCPPAVGMFVERDQENPNAVNLCTATLVAPDVVVTNSHCLNKNLTAGDSCEGVAAIVFPAADGYRARRAGCARVISREGPGADDAVFEKDTAFLRLAAPLRRPPLPLNHEGVNDRQPVTLYRVNPTRSKDGSVLGSLQSEKCRAEVGTAVFPQLDSGTSAGFVLAACPIVHGNSGSPVLNEGGGVVGILQKGMITGEAKIPNEKNMAAATNFACTFAPGETGSVLPASCLQGYTHDQLAAYAARKSVEDFQNGMNASLVQSAETWGHQSLPEFQWAMGSQMAAIDAENARLYFPVPVCANGRRLKASGDAFFDGHDDVQLPYYTVSMELNDDLKWALKLVPAGTWDVRIGYSPSQLRQDGVSSVSLERRADPRSPYAEFVSTTIPLCR